MFSYRDCCNQCSKTRILDYCNDREERRSECGCESNGYNDYGNRRNACSDSRQALCDCACNNRFR